MCVLELLTRCIYNIGRLSFLCLRVLRYYTIHNHHHIRHYNFFSLSYALVYWIRFRSYGCWCSQFCSAGFLQRILLMLLVFWCVDCWHATDQSVACQQSNIVYAMCQQFKHTYKLAIPSTYNNNKLDWQFRNYGLETINNIKLTKTK